MRWEQPGMAATGGGEEEDEKEEEGAVGLGGL
jgi:hypothetical protein